MQIFRQIKINILCYKALKYANCTLMKVAEAEDRRDNIYFCICNPMLTAQGANTKVKTEKTKQNEQLHFLLLLFSLISSLAVKNG